MTVEAWEVLAKPGAAPPAAAAPAAPAAPPVWNTAPLAGELDDTDVPF
jgi:hypothetical protein